MALVVVQRGHVPRTTGATGAPGEQAFAIAAADRVAAHLRPLGHQARIINADVPLSSYRGDLFVALHYDSSTNPAAHGASVGYQPTEGNRFAQAWKRRYATAGWTGGFRGDNYTSALGGYYGVRHAVGQGNRRAFIAEAGFHSNPGDAALLAAPGGPDRVGRAVAAAVAELMGSTGPQPPPPPNDKELLEMIMVQSKESGAVLLVTGNATVLIVSTAELRAHAAAGIPVVPVGADQFKRYEAIRAA